MARRGLILAAFAVSSVIVSGCGDDDSEGSAQGANTDSAAGVSASPDSAAMPGTTAGLPAATTIAAGPAAAATVAAATAAPSTAAPTIAAATTVPPAPLPAAASIESAPLRVGFLFDAPLLTALASRPSDRSMYVTSQGGQVYRVAGGAPPEQVLDISSIVTAYVSGSERGLLGIAFSPTDGRMYLYYTDDDPDPDSHIISYALDASGLPDPASVREVFAIDQPGLGHKGGGLAFSPDGILFVASGDGGGSNGADAQDYTKMLGGIIRILPNADGPGYTVPPDNPFVGQADKAPEMWAKGLRNPWGFCRDAATGDLWWGDVGNNSMEEIDHMPAGTSGTNYGWPAVEGTQVNHPDRVPADAVAPVYAYNHSDVGPAVIGGCVYRGVASPALAGAYVFADLTGQLFAIGADYQVVPLGISAPAPVTGFGIAPDGELIILTMQDGAFHLAPAVPAA